MPKSRAHLRSAWEETHDLDQSRSKSAAETLEDTVASRLWEAAVTKVPCPPVRNDFGNENILGAYRIQYANARRRIKDGAAHVGFKVGLTSAAVQQQLGYFEPNFGQRTSHAPILRFPIYGHTA
jgi:hypothetical protein